MRRRDALILGAAALAGCARPATSSSARMPSIFLAHGSPMLLDDQAWVGELASWARAMPRPTAILMVSAHWLEAPIALSSTTTVPLVYDFYNFPQRYYETKYPAPGAPALAARLKSLLSSFGTIVDGDRGLDHGAYVPLVAMYPNADVPVLQMSIPTLSPRALVSVGQALAPLRDEGVLVVGSGFLTHNLRALDRRPDAPIQSWAREFDAWCEDALARRDVDLLSDYQQKAPGVREALPTVEHYVPVLVALGASTPHTERVTFPITGLSMGSLTRRSVQFG